jgi:drug/metabolite transporter (DMT)-like permease
MFNMSLRYKTALQALLVTFLWSTSFVLIKIGLDDIPSLTFAGLRYGIAFLILLPFGLRQPNRDYLRQLTRRDYLQLGLLGLVFYTATQGTQFLALDKLPPATVSLLLSFSAIAVILIAIVILREYPTLLQWGGVGVYVVGVLVFFYPIVIPAEEGLGILIGVTSMFANSISAVMGRSVNRGGKFPAIIVTLISMGVGSAILLIAGLITQGLPALSLSNWLIILWLAGVNTALTFTLWNHTQRTLTATESSIINNTMLVQIAILAWIFLGDSISWTQGIGMIFASAGILIVQLWSRSEKIAEVERAAQQESVSGEIVS